MHNDMKMTCYAYFGTSRCGCAVFGLLEASSYKDARKHIGTSCKIKRVSIPRSDYSKNYNSKRFVESCFT